MVTPRRVSARVIEKNVGAAGRPVVMRLFYVETLTGGTWAVRREDEGHARDNLGNPVTIEIRCEDDQFAYFAKCEDHEHYTCVHDSVCPEDEECEATGLVLFDNAVLAMVGALIEYEVGDARTVTRKRLLEDNATSLTALRPLIDRYCEIRGLS